MPPRTAAILVAAAATTVMFAGCDERRAPKSGGPAAHSHDHDHDHDHGHGDGHDHGDGHGHGHDHAGHDHDHGHEHPPLPKVANYTALVTELRAHTAAIEQKLAAGSLDGLHNDAYVVTELAAIAGKLALEDASVPRELVRDANEAGKALARAADELHSAADAGKLEDSRRLLTAMQPMVNRVAAAAPERWVCDMHCEPGKVYPANTKCPVCRMDLTRIGDIPFSAILSPISPTLEAGRPADLKIDLRDRVGLPVDKLDVVHEHPLHLIVVSDDLSAFIHEHPARQADGSFKATITFPRPGDYTLFADITPTGEGQQAPSAQLTIPGQAPAPTPLTEDAGEVHAIDAYEFRIRCNGGKFFAGRDSLVRYGITLSGEPVTDLEPYLGGLGHLVIISQDLKTFVHSHPLNDEAGHDHGHDHDHEHAGHDHGGRSAADLLAESAQYGNGHPADPVFHVVFPAPGLYKSFAQFKHKGRVLTVPFTIEAKPEDGSPPFIKPTSPAPAGGHADHDHSGHGGAK